MTSQPGSGRASHQAEIDLTEARKAFFLMVGFVALIWALQVANWADSYRLDQEYGIIARDAGRLPDIFTAPFLHFNWNHIEANSGPLFVFGLLAAYRGVLRFLGVTVLVAVTSGLAAWFFQAGNTVGAGASGLIFGYFGYVVSRGLIDRNVIDTLAGLVMALSYAYLVTVAIPGTPGIGWQAHLGGLVGGVAAGWVFRTRRGKTASSGRLPAVAGATGSTAGAGSGAFRPGSDSPRADLHKELDDLGL
jgi:membrane associated rhomboid family serine protease